jgi:hypothetical protein
MERLDLGSAPSQETCAQVGSEDYAEKARRECRALIGQLIRTVGEPPAGVRFRIVGNPHDFGTYYTVVVEYDGNDTVSAGYAARCDEATPDYWDAIAREELGVGLLPAEIAATLPPLYSQESQGEEAIARVKFFTPWTSWTWYASEYDPEDRLFFGIVVGHEREFGYFALDELQAIRGPGGLRIERDLYWSPKPLKVCR